MEFFVFQQLQEMKIGEKIFLIRKLGPLKVIFKGAEYLLVLVLTFHPVE